MDGHIAKKDWSGFFAAFAKTHEDYDAPLETIGRAFGDQKEATWMPLAGISYDAHHNQLFITLSHRKAPPLRAGMDRC